MKRSEIREEIGKLKGLVRALEEGVRAEDLEREVERLREALESKDRKLWAAEERVRALEAMDAVQEARRWQTRAEDLEWSKADLDSKILRLERELSMLGGLRAIYDERAGERRSLSIEGEEVVVVYFDEEGNRLSRARLNLGWFFECERRKGPLCRRGGE